MSAYEKRGESDEWYTPKYIFDALDLRFDLDVAAQIGGPLHVPCEAYMTSEHDALSRRRFGLVWMNPPFGHQRQKIQWLERFFQHGNGIALVPDRTSAPWWQRFAPMADAICFVAPKVKFIRADGTIGESPGTGTCLFACGEVAANALRNSGLGVVMERRA